MATQPLREILLVGFGAVGAIYSLIIKRSGLARVTVVARSNFDVVNQNGMHFKSDKYGDIRGWKPDRLCPTMSSAADQAYDYVILTTKAVPDLVKTTEILSPLLCRPYIDRFSQPAYVVLQNGLNVENDLYNAIDKLGQGTPKVIGTALYIGTNLEAPDVVRHNDFDRPMLGMYRHNDFTTMKNNVVEEEILGGIAQILEAGGSTVTIVPEIQRIKFAKNFWNVAFSSLTTLTNYALPAIFRPPPGPSANYTPYVAPQTADLIEEYTIPTLEAVLNELLTLGRALGFPDSEDGIPSSHVKQIIEATRKIHLRPDSVHKPSMLLDAQNGAPIEVEVILGGVVRMARQKGVPVPRVETLYALLLVVQNQIVRKMTADAGNRSKI